MCEQVEVVIDAFQIFVDRLCDSSKFIDLIETGVEVFGRLLLGGDLGIVLEFRGRTTGGDFDALGDPVH